MGRILHEFRKEYRFRTVLLFIALISGIYAVPEDGKLTLHMRSRVEDPRERLLIGHVSRVSRFEPCVWWAAPARWTSLTSSRPRACPVDRPGGRAPGGGPGVGR